MKPQKVLMTTVFVTVASLIPHSAFADGIPYDKARVGICHNFIQNGSAIEIENKVGSARMFSQGEELVFEHSDHSGQRILEVNGKPVSNQEDVEHALENAFFDWEKPRSTATISFDSGKVDFDYCYEVRPNGQGAYLKFDIWNDEVISYFLFLQALRRTNLQATKWKYSGNFVTLFIKRDGERQDTMVASMRVTNTKEFVYIVYLDQKYRAAFIKYAEASGEKYKVIDGDGLEEGKFGMAFYTSIDGRQAKDVFRDVIERGRLHTVSLYGIDIKERDKEILGMENNFRYQIK